MLSGCEKSEVSGAAIADGHEIIRVALTEDNPSHCELIDLQSGLNSKDTCYSILALSRKEVSLCENVLGVTVTDKGTLTKEVCIQRVTQVLEDDQKIEEAKEIYQEAFENPEVCNKILDSIGRDVCLENSAVKNKDVKTCEMMNINEGKQECLFRVILQLGDSSLCGKLEATTGKYSKDLCYNNIAVNLLNPEICSGISLRSGPFSQDACLGSIAVVTKERSVCEMINVEGGVISQESCLSLITT